MRKTEGWSVALMNSKSQSTLFEADRQGDKLVITLRGEWDIRENPPGFSAVEGMLGSNGSAPETVTFEAAELGMYDSSLISLLLNVRKHCEEGGKNFDDRALPKGINQLLDMALAVPEKRDARAGTTERSFIHKIGQSSINLINELFGVFEFLGDCILSFWRFITGRAKFRRKELWVLLQECGIEALPIVSLISLLIGMILAFVGAHQMASIGTVIFVADLVAIAMVREMGCLMAGIIMSGRTGAAFAAQLGSMKVNEEIDALKTFGFSPVDFLVLPRMLALIIMMPLLTVYANIVGMVGGMIVVCFGYDVGLGQYVDQTIGVLSIKNFLLGVGKSVIFGMIIAGAGCLRGMQSGSSASAVGTAATSAVVISITAIIVADSVFAVISTILGF